MNTMKWYHRQIHKSTKTECLFSNDASLQLLVYLAYRNTKTKMDDDAFVN